MSQVTFYDIVSDKEREDITPEVWGCIKTCANFTNVESDGSLDFFPGTKEPRCTRTCFKSKLINNFWHTKCQNYKPKEG